MDNLLEGLNPEQTEAVLYDKGSLLVLAGAGSGKTRVITHRFVHLIRKHGLGMHNILCVTFTNKAAGEMKERIGHLLGVDTRTAWVRTFHSMCVRMLREHAQHICYPKDFTIYDAQDTKNTIKKIMERLNINPKEVPDKAVIRAVSKAKEDFLSPDALSNKAKDQFERTVAEIYTEYQLTLKANQAMDFSDLINNTIILLQNTPNVRERYQHQWAFIMADEFQDTNSPQYLLLELLSRNKENVCVVGDDDQSIYGWRGAKVENIQKFHQEFKAHIIRLERNYRSHGNILAAANGIVQAIKGRMPKTLKAEREQGNKITFASLGDDRLQAAFVYEEMSKLLNNNYKDFAVLYRTNSQSRLIEEILTRHGVPYRVFGGMKFYDRAEIKDLVCYLRLIVNPFDSAAFDRVVNVPKRKVGDKGKEHIDTFMRAGNLNYHQTCLQAQRIEGLNSVAAFNLEKLGVLLEEFHKKSLEISPLELIKKLLDGINYRAWLIEEYGSAEAEDRMENISELINAVKVFEELNPEAGIADFLNEASLLSGGEENAEVLKNSVSLMTIHSAKGLEFPMVFVIGLCEGLLPLGSAATDEELNEEKRLFYVAITRAMNKLFLSHEKRSLRYGEWRESEPSHFIDMIPKDVLDRRKGAENSYSSRDERYTYKRSDYSYGNAKIKPAVVKKLKTEDILVEEKHDYKTQELQSLEELKAGDKIMHHIFGEGEIEYVSSAMVRVVFKRFGKQVLMGNVLSNIKKIIG